MSIVCAHCICVSLVGTCSSFVFLFCICSLCVCSLFEPAIFCVCNLYVPVVDWVPSPVVFVDFAVVIVCCSSFVSVVYLSAFYNKLLKER